MNLSGRERNRLSCQRKCGYKSKKLAKKVAKKQLEEGKCSQALAVYRCSFCGLWHMSRDTSGAGETFKVGEGKAPSLPEGFYYHKNLRLMLRLVELSDGKLHVTIARKGGPFPDQAEGELVVWKRVFDPAEIFPVIAAFKSFRVKDPVQFTMNAKGEILR